MASLGVGLLCPDTDSGPKSGSGMSPYSWAELATEQPGAPGALEWNGDSLLLLAVVLSSAMVPTLCRSSVRVSEMRGSWMRLPQRLRELGIPWQGSY